MYLQVTYDREDDLILDILYEIQRIFGSKELSNIRFDSDGQNRSD